VRRSYDGQIEEAFQLRAASSRPSTSRGGEISVKSVIRRGLLRVEDPLQLNRHANEAVRFLLAADGAPGEGS
jgi:hypothetical protein